MAHALSLIGISILTLLINSCSSVSKSYMNESVKVKIDAPMQAKIDVDMTKKLTGYASGGYLLHFFKVAGDNKYVDNVHFNGNEPHLLSFLSKVDKIKGAATYNAIRTSAADILVNPQYVVEENHWNPFYKQIKVKVTGYPGRLVSIKNKQ